ncbi:MAG: hypothetical protein U9N32_01875 [Spirochaetota bacterium]|nr:hypothetical protein [Spirochaetota bacterium]
MKYNLIPSENSNSSDTIFIYILPSSFEGSSYSIAYPDYTSEDILAQKIGIRTFDGCSLDALGEIEDKLKERLQKKHLKLEERLNTLFTAGIGVFILGIINWVIPDPLPLVDELLFTIGGGLTAWKAWKDRKVKLSSLEEQIFRYGYDGIRPEIETDNFLSLIFKSIRCKIDPAAAGEKIEDLDSIEIETLWLTRYLNIQDISDLKDHILVIERVSPVKKLAKLEAKKQTLKNRNRLEAFRKETVQETGITDSALTVYIEFYKLYKNILAN